MLCAAALSSAAAGERLRIVASTPDLASIASAIAGEQADVRAIATGKEDPHFLQARPSFVVALRDADLWVRMGMELEAGWEPLLLRSSHNPRIQPGRPGHFDAGTYTAYVLEVPGPDTSRAQGDVHPSGNPHYLLDPLNARSVARALAQRMAEIDPAHAANFQQGLARWQVALDRAMFGEALAERFGGDALWERLAEGTLETWLAEQNRRDELGGWIGAMEPWRNRSILTFHKSFAYLAHRFGLTVANTLEPVPGVPPSPAHLADLARQIGRDAIPLLLMEPYYPRRPADFLARQTGLRVAVASSYGISIEPGGYLQFMNDVLSAFAGKP